MPPVDRRRFIELAAGAGCLSFPGAGHTTQRLRELQLVVPAPPGSQPDVLARWLIEPMARLAGVAGNVINRPGAAGAIAADAVLKAAPESGSLLLGGLDHVAYSHLNSQRAALDPLKDFVPAGVVNRDTWMLVASKEQPARSLSALVELSRADRLHYASNGEGSTAHLLSARLCAATGLRGQHVPYKDPWLPDLMAGRVHFALAPTPAVLNVIRGDRVIALATLTDERLPQVAGVPTIRELGYRDQVFYGGLFLFAPAGLSAMAPHVNGWLLATLRTAEMQQRFRDAAIEPGTEDLEGTREAVLDRLSRVDAMRLAVFGRAR
jgi:tripartite-type tricarboxylate transporter receptor subunit TctC